MPSSSPPPPTAPRATSTPDRTRRVYLETFGCQMNVLDSQLVRSQLQALGYRFVDAWRDADVVLYNTCSVREHAEQKVWSRVGQVGLHKRHERPGLVLGVIGCMAERDGEAMARRYPQIDVLCGPGELDKLPMLIDNAVRTADPDADDNARFAPPRTLRTQVALQGNTHRRSQTLAAAEDELERIDLARSFAPEDQLAAGRSAYVRITRGCNKFCTYCVVPFTRGREIHRPPEHIVDECRRLVDAGVREITLLGQTVNHYHFNHDAAQTVNGLVQPQIGAVVRNNGNAAAGGARPSLAEPLRTGVEGGEVTSFAALLARIHDELPALERLRFVTSFPRDFGDDILRVMAERPRICRYLHMPVQHGSNRILKLMNRGYTVEQYLELVERIRAHLPDAELATDIICGFPTETEAEHELTAELLRRCGFKNAFIFKYSPRPGTTAAQRFADDVPDVVKKRRNNELLAVQSEVSAAVHGKYVGRTLRVFVDAVSAKARKAGNGGLGGVELGWEAAGETTQLTGRTDTDLIVIFEGDPALIGRSVDIEIDRAAPLALFGRPAPAPVPATP
ncbi:MAG: MiaB/RimO family radical SAM methylthiotransferase [Phycisphaeraceae bacterium]